MNHNIKLWNYPFQAIASSTVGNAQEYEDFEELTDDFDVQELQESLDNKLVQEQENYDEVRVK